MSTLPFGVDYMHSHVTTDSMQNCGSTIKHLISDNVDTDKLPLDLAGLFCLVAVDQKPATKEHLTTVDLNKLFRIQVARFDYGCASCSSCSSS